MRMPHLTALALTASMALPAGAEVPVINSANAERVNDMWNFTVTIDHEDRGWGDYVTGWRLIDPTGQEIGRRELHMPHDGPRARTRSLSGVEVEVGTAFVDIEVQDSKLGWTGERYRLELR